MPDDVQPRRLVLTGAHAAQTVVPVQINARFGAGGSLRRRAERMRGQRRAKRRTQDERADDGAQE